MNTPHILIDADGCPVVEETIALGAAYAVPCFILCDTSHEFQREGATTIVISQGKDTVDFALVNRIRPRDIVVTQDYGLAAMSLAKKAIVLNEDGQEYTNETIDSLLYARHMAQEQRKKGMHLGPRKKKRTPTQDTAFSAALEAILQKQKLDTDRL